MSQEDNVLIQSHPDFRIPQPSHQDYLNVSEFFCDTIQGENFIGWPATFLRMQDCTLNCVWCDTSEVWRYGNPYTFDVLFERMEQYDVIRKLKEGQHLVLTGGSPLKQQRPLIRFISKFIDRYGFKPYIEIENECTLIPEPGMIEFVDLWNNSPKLTNAKNPKGKQYRPYAIKLLAELQNSWFKFVVNSNADWYEIVDSFITPGLINKNQIVLMPMGASRAELLINRQIVINIAIRNNVRYSTREHIIVWDKKTGV